MIHFYLLTADKKIVASDLPLEKIKKKLGSRYEVINSIKDRSVLDVIKARMLRSYPGFSFEEMFQVSKTFSEETKKKISESKIGKPRDELTRRKISLALKGRSNFNGKKHSDETKTVMSEKKIGNQHTKDTYWAHDPRSDKETRVKDRRDVPPGYSLGRDYYSTEAGLYYFKNGSGSKSE